MNYIYSIKHCIIFSVLIYYLSPLVSQHTVDYDGDKFNSDLNCNGITDNSIDDIIDLYEPNDTCTSPKDLNNIKVGRDEHVYEANIYPKGDKDYFRFYFIDEIPACTMPLEQPLYTVIIIIEPSVFEDLDIYLYNDNCILLSKSVSPDFAREKLVYQWKGNCWKLDSQYFRILIKDKSGSYSCNNYKLKIKMIIE